MSDGVHAIQCHSRWLTGQVFTMPGVTFLTKFLNALAISETYVLVIVNIAGECLPPDPRPSFHADRISAPLPDGTRFTTVHVCRQQILRRIFFRLTSSLCYAMMSSVNLIGLWKKTTSRLRTDDGCLKAAIVLTWVAKEQTKLARWTKAPDQIERSQTFSEPSTVGKKALDYTERCTKILVQARPGTFMASITRVIR